MLRRWPFFVSAAFLLVACHKSVPPEQADAATICVQPEHWNALLGIMREFGAKHDLELHGGIRTALNGKRSFNAFLARGYSYWWSDDLDLWVISKPDTQQLMSVSLIAKKPQYMSDLILSDGLLAAANPVRCAWRLPVPSHS